MTIERYYPHVAEDYDLLFRDNVIQYLNQYASALERGDYDKKRWTPAEILRAVARDIDTHGPFAKSSPNPSPQQPLR